MKSFCSHIIIVAACLISLTACNQPISKYPDLTPEEIAAEEQAQHKMLQHFAKQGGAPRPWRKNKMSRKRFDRVADRIEKAGAKVCQGLKLPEHDMRCYYYFKTKGGDEINAYADGERIIVTSGMRRFVNNDDELAMVLAHELAHNLMGHIAAMENNALVGLMIGAAIDGVASSQGVRGGYADEGAYIGAVAYSPEFEREADYIGLYILARAGYNITRATQLWKRFTVENPEAMYASITHPSNPERFALLKKAIAEINKKRKMRQPLIPNLKAE